MINGLTCSGRGLGIAILGLGVLNVPAVAQVTGDDCSDPIVLTVDTGSLPIVDANTTVGLTDDYEDTCMGSYDGGSDIIYRLDVPEDICVSITVDADTIWAGVAVFSACPADDPNSCIVQATTSANPDVIDGVDLVAGTYWLMVDTFPAPEDTSFTLTIDACAIGRCCYPGLEGETFCADNTLPDCNFLGGVWDATLTCDTPCPTTTGNDCSDPIGVVLPADLTYVDVNTTFGRVDDYEDTCMGSYDGGEDIIYVLDVTEDICVDITVDADTIWVGVAVFSACPADDPASCIAQATTSANPDVINGLELAAGTYWLMIDTFPAPENASFTLTIDECAVGRCCYPGLEGELLCADNLLSECDALGGTWEAGLNCTDNPCPLPPPNDFCVNATVITDDDLPFTDLGVDLPNATDDPNVDPSCDSSFSCATGPANNGVWYQYTPAVNCLLEFGDIVPDVATSIWTGEDCFSLTEVFCSDPDPFTFELTGGVTYWILVSNWSCSSEPSGPIDVSINCIPIIATGACCIDDVCSILSEADCLAGGGQYLGDDSACSVLAAADPSFETGSPNAVWAEASTNFGTPLCTIALCGTGTGTGPRTGDWWAWFGGIPSALEVASVEQSIVIPSDATTLTFWYENAVSSGNGTDALVLTIDGNVELTLLESQLPGLGYQQLSVDITAYADDAAHLIRFEGTTSGFDAGGVGASTNFFVDDIDIDVSVCPSGEPCPWDFDGSGDVGTSDFFALLQNWGSCPVAPDPCPWDFDNSGDVGTSDFFELLQNWGACP